MAKRKPPSEHFARGFGKPGWVYVSRNDLHREDVYKVGYTTTTPEERVKMLNSEQRNRTSQIGFFFLAYACAVFDSQDVEQALFKRLEKFRVSPKKEFINAPLEYIAGELSQLQNVSNEKVKASVLCRHCQTVMMICPLPQVLHQCQSCGSAFNTLSDGTVLQGEPASGRKANYFPHPELLLASRHSQLASEFLRLRAANMDFINGKLSKDELSSIVVPLSEVEIIFDRIGTIHRSTLPTKKRATLRSADNAFVQLTRSRRGWISCPECITSIKVQSDGSAECLECGWVQQPTT